jgi:integrase
MPKRNAHGAGSIRQRKDGTWEARYSIGRDPGTGKQVQRSIYGKTQRDVRQKLSSVVSSLDSGSYIEPSRLLFGAWLDIWLDEYNINVKPRTLLEYKGQCNYRIKPFLGSIKLALLRPHDVQMFLNKQSVPSKNMKALNPKSIHNLHGILHKALEQAVKIGYLKFNPANACILPRIVKSSVKPFDNEQIKLFLSTIKGHHLESLFMLDLFTGLRKGEIIGLTWDCIQGDSIFIYRQLQCIKGKYFFMPLKNNKTRRIVPAQSIMHMLLEHKKRQHDLMQLFNDAWGNKEGFVFTNEVGNHLCHDTVYKIFKRIVTDLGFPSFRFHDLRHSYAVASLRAGDDVKTVQENLGHHTAAFTLDVYGHVTDEMRRDSSSRMDAFFQSIISM